MLGGVKIVDKPDQLVFLGSNNEVLWEVGDSVSMALPLIGVAVIFGTETEYPGFGTLS